VENPSFHFGLVFGLRKSGVTNVLGSSKRLIVQVSFIQRSMGECDAELSEMPVWTHSTGHARHDDSSNLGRGVFQAVGDLWPELWFKATLMDAYFGFLTFYVWVAYKERRNLARILWFVLIMCFGNIAIATYVLILLFRMAPGDSMETLLTKRVS
jgi:hypothetical protein